MDKAEHGRRLKQAMASGQVDRRVVADALGVNPRTVTNWTSGATLPSAREREALRRLMGDYDSDGDPVERALAASGLPAWRQDAVRSEYRRHLYEQERESAQSG